ncbi:hypothetical protein D9758_015399 [Tetrapyrgos nigripes]|uniref:Uncharacterized protein n=1 Tax=Tetrapyrgos nigripes TaxID=182062 RepID=A0A8H5FND8_9AGAR|nr:hypothetical protein D9758_015399 [Tetrapyrgos nigripes]
MSFELLKTSAKRGSYKAIEQLGEVVQFSHEFWETIPIFMRHIPPQLPEPVDLLSAPPDSSHVLAKTSLGAIAKCLRKGGVVTDKISKSICNNWPRIQSCLTVLIGIYTKSQALNREAREFHDSLLSVASELIRSVTYYRAIADSVLKIPGTISFMINLFVRTARVRVFDETTKNCHAALQGIPASPDWSRIHYDVFLASFDQVDVNFISVVIQGLVSCVEFTLPIEDIHTAVAVFNTAISYSGKLRRAAVAHHSVYWSIALFQKLILFRTKDEYELRDLLGAITYCIVYIDQTFHSRGHAVVGSALQNRLLLLMLRAVPLLFPEDASLHIRGVQALYFQLMDSIAAESTTLCVLRALSKSWREIGKKGYYKKFVEDSQKQVKSRWLQLRKTGGRALSAEGCMEADISEQSSAEKCQKNSKGGPSHTAKQCFIAFYLRNYGLAQPLDDREKIFRMFLVERGIHDHEKDAPSDERKYREAHPSVSPYEPLVHVHQYHSGPMRREVMTLEDARKLITKEPWLWDPQELAHTQKLFLAGFRRPYRNIQYIVTRQLEEDPEGLLHSKEATEDRDQKVDADYEMAFYEGQKELALMGFGLSAEQAKQALRTVPQ